MCLETDPFVGRPHADKVVIHRGQVLFSLPEEAPGCRWLRVGAGERGRHVKVVLRVGRGVLTGEVLLVALTLLLVLLGTAVHLLVEELVSVLKVPLEGGAGGEGIAGSKLAGVDVDRSWEALLESPQLRLDVLSDCGGIHLVIDVLIRVPLEKEPLDNLASLLVWELPGLFQNVTAR